MCGIAGVIAFDDFTITENYLCDMRDTLVHRGPDDSGFWISKNKNIGLAHRRLSILDLSNNARQPMANFSNTLLLAFNGEIYNHRALRQELENLGYTKWKTDHSDTEVLLNAFEAWGINCLDKLRGMFAFAIWDQKEQVLWLVRDRLGIKPIYYSVHNNRLVFASEIKALLRDPQQKRQVNETALYHYLSFLTTPAPDTLFEGIKKLPAAHYLKVDLNGKLEEKKYWELWDKTEDLTKLSEKQLQQRILKELKASIKLRKESDVPVGIFLSGGIDSSTNAALFSENQNNINTYSIGYKGDNLKYQNELGYAKFMAKTIGANYHERLLTVDDLLKFLPEMIKLQDEPIADPVCIPVYYVSELARKNGSVVCQVGEGADELFFGYPSWKQRLMIQRLAALPYTKSLKKFLRFCMRFLGAQETWPYAFLSRDLNHQPIFWSGAEAFSEQRKKNLLSQALQNRLGNISSWDVLAPLYKNFKLKAKEKNDLNWMSYVDLNLRLPELLLMRVDKMSMGVSLEARVPFLDHKFVELAMSVPTKLKTKKGLKYLLKEVVRGIIPDKLIDRKKQGFGVPIYTWFMEKLGEYAKKEIDSFVKRTGYFAPEAINKMFKKKEYPKIWYILNFVLWHKYYIEEKSISDNLG